MRCDLPVFDRSKPFSSYVRFRNSRFCISCDDLGDYWLSCLGDDYPFYFFGPYSLLDAFKSFRSTLNYSNHMEVLSNERRV